MPNINDLSIKQIDEECGIFVEKNDMVEILDKQFVINIFVDQFKYVADNVYRKRLIDFLEKYEEYVDKEKLMIAVYEYKKQHEEELRKYNNSQYEKNIKNLEKYLKQPQYQSVGYVVIDANTNKDKSKLMVDINIKSVQRSLYNRVLTSKKNMNNIVNSLSLSTMNRILKDNLVNHNSIYNAPSTGNIIYTFINSTEFANTFVNYGGIAKILRGVLVDGANDIDIVKMCLMSFYKLQRRLENGAFEEKNRKEYSKMLKELYNVVKGKQVQILLEDDTIYTSKDMEEKARQFYNDNFYTEEEIENMILDTIKNGMKNEKGYRSFFKDYMSAKNRKIKNILEFKFAYMYIFNKSEIINMYLNEQVNIEDIKQAMAEDDSIQLVTDKDFINNYKMVQNKAKNKMLSNKERENNRKIQDLYVQSNLLGERRNEHIETILEKLNSQEDIEYLLKNSIINEEDIIKYTLKKVINRDVFMQMYLSEKIHLETIKSIVQDNQKDFYIKEIIDEDELMKKIIVNKKAKNQKKDTEIRKLALLYKTLLVDKTEKEKEELANEFVMNLEIKLEEKKMPINSEDRIYLYEIGIIPIDTVIYWGDNNEIIKLLNKGIINFKDIKQLYKKNIINDDVLTRTIMSNDI